MQVLLIVFLVIAIALVGIILLQQGKGAGMGASFGSGASGTVFGAPGSGSVLTRITTVLAILFFSVALALGYLSSKDKGVVTTDIFDQIEQQDLNQSPANTEELAPELNEEVKMSDMEKPVQVEEAAPEQEAQIKPEETKKDDQGGNE